MIIHNIQKLGKICNKDRHDFLEQIDMSNYVILKYEDEIVSA